MSPAVRRAAALIGGLGAAWALAGLLGALLYSRPGFLLVLSLGWEAAHLPLREVGLWAIGGGLTAALLWALVDAIDGRTAAAVGALWALAGPFNWRPGPVFAAASASPQALYLDNDFAFYPVGALMGALLLALLLRRALPHADGWAQLMAFGGWVGGYGLFTLLTGYAIPLYVLRARVVNLQMGLLFGVLFGVCGGLGLWAALRRTEGRTPPGLRHRQQAVRPNPLAAHLVRPNRRAWLVTGVLGLALLALGVGVTLWLGARVSFNRPAVPLLLRRMPLLPLAGLLPLALLMASAGAVIANAGGSRQWMQLLPLAGMPRRQIAWSYTLAVWVRLRGLLMLAVAGLPVVVWLTLELWRVSFYVPGGPTLGAVVAVWVVAVGMVGLSGLAAVVGVWLSLTRGPSTLWVAVAPLLTLAVALVPLFLLLTAQPISTTRGLAEAAGALLFALWPVVMSWSFITALDNPTTAEGQLLA